jgi:hypothetical protein
MRFIKSSRAAFLFLLMGTMPVWLGAVELVSLLSSEGQARFERSTIKTDFFPLANQFESQTNRIFCGPATAAIALNALRADDLRAGKINLTPDQSLLAQEDRKYLDPKRVYVFNRYTQNNVFDLSYRGKTSPSKTKLQVLGEPMPGQPDADWGFQLRHLGELLKAHGLDVVTRVVSDDLAATEIRKELTNTLKRKGSYALVNYARPSLNQAGGGHISPLGAYDEKSDSFLIMDVNPNTDNWVWVSADDLIASMRTFDTVENRGYLLVSEGK